MSHAQGLLLLFLLCALSIQSVAADYSTWSELPQCAKDCFSYGVDNTFIPCGFSLACDCQGGKPVALINTCLLSSPPCDTNPIHDAVATYGNEVFCNASSPDSATYEVIEGTYSLAVALYTELQGQSTGFSIQMSSTVTPSASPSSSSSSSSSTQTTSTSTSTSSSSTDDEGNDSPSTNDTPMNSAAPSTTATSGPTSSLLESLVTSYSTQVVTAAVSSGTSGSTGTSAPPATVTIIAAQPSGAAMPIRFGQETTSISGTWWTVMFSMAGVIVAHWRI